MAVYVKVKAVFEILNTIPEAFNFILLVWVSFVYPFALASLVTLEVHCCRFENL